MLHGSVALSASSAFLPLLSGQHLTCSHLLPGLLHTCSPLISSNSSKFMVNAFAPDLAALLERPGLVLLKSTLHL